MKKSTFKLADIVFSVLAVVIIGGIAFIVWRDTRPPKQYPVVAQAWKPAFWTTDPRSVQQWEADCKPVLIRDEFGTEMTACTDNSNIYDRDSVIKPTDTIISSVYYDYPTARGE